MGLDFPLIVAVGASVVASSAISCTVRLTSSQARDVNSLLAFRAIDGSC